MLQQEIEQYLAKGGTIEVVPPVELEVARKALQDSMNQDYLDLEEPDDEEIDLEELEEFDELDYIDED